MQAAYCGPGRPGVSVNLNWTSGTFVFEFWGPEWSSAVGSPITTPNLGIDVAADRNEGAG